MKLKRFFIVLLICVCTAFLSGCVPDGEDAGSPPDPWENWETEI